MPRLSTGSMLEQSDLVVIGQFEKTVDVPAMVVPEDLPENIRVRSHAVETSFDVLAILKGDTRVRRISLYHYRLIAELAPLTNFQFLSFGPKKEDEVYLMFLKKLPDGRYTPTGGQVSLFLSILKLPAHSFLNKERELVPTAGAPAVQETGPR